MRFTDRLNLKLPEPQDSYNIQDFTDNFQQIVDSLAGIPTITNYLTLEEFINSGTADDLKRGDTVAINNLIYILVGSDPLNASHYMVYGAEALVIMREYVPIAERIKGSMYLQLGKTRRLIVRVFKKFFGKTKNLIPYPFYETTKTSNGITFTDNNDGTVTANGTASATTSFICNHRIDGKMILGSGKYIVSGCPSGGNSTTYRLVVAKTSTTGSFELITRDWGNGATFELTEDTDIYVGCEIASGATVNNLTFYPMLRHASITDDTYEPYKEVESDASTLLFQKTSKKTTNISDGNKYRFTCKNLSILAQGENPERLEGKIYFVADTEE